MKEGRPSKYKAEYCEQAKKLAQLGATDRQVADFFEVTEQTINNWKIDHPEFFESLKLGKDVADRKVEESLYKRAVGYTHDEEKVFVSNGEIITHQTTRHYPPDSTSMIFWLKNRKPNEWRDKREITGADGEPLIPEFSEMDLARKIAFILSSAENESCH